MGNPNIEHQTLVYLKGLNIKLLHRKFKSISELIYRENKFKNWKMANKNTVMQASKIHILKYNLIRIWVLKETNIKGSNSKPQQCKKYNASSASKYLLTTTISNYMLSRSIIKKALFPQLIFLMIINNLS